MILIIFILGLIIGSFINAAVWRIHEGKPLGNDRSECPNCGHKLHAKDLIPVLSWLYLRGKCRYCNDKISLQYPLVEFLTAIIFALSASVWNFGAVTDIAFFVIWLVIATILIILAVYDFRWMLLPNTLMSLLLIAVMTYVALLAIVDFSAFESNIKAAIVFGGSTFLLYQFSEGKWIGGGDVKLLFIMGLFLGLRDALIAFMLAVYSGALVSLALIVLTERTRKDLVPFGPFLIGGTVIALLFGQSIADWYLNLIV